MTVKHGLALFFVFAAGILFFAPHAHATEPLAPPILSLNVSSSNEIDISWGAIAAEPTVTGYTIERDNGGGFTTIAVNLNATSYADTNLTPGAFYGYRVTAIN